jgi:hypothetical protein
VHQELIARISEPLKAMMQGRMQEAQSGSATLEEVDKVTFGRFLEFV